MNEMDDIITEINYDATEVKMNGGASLLPDGEYRFLIKNVKPMKTGKGFPMINLELGVLDGEFAGKKVWHNIVFFPPKDEEGKPCKGAGFALFFLSCIGEPHEGQFKAKPFQWIGKTVMAKTKTEKYTDKEGNEKTKNGIAWFIKPLTSDAPVVDEEIPF